MAEAEQQTNDQVSDHEDDDFKTPAEKSIDEILEADKDDESLAKYKEKLLGPKVEPIFPDDQRKVIPLKMVILVQDRKDMELDLRAIEKGAKKESFVIKEGVKYRLKVVFFVQREIVQGLKYVSKTSRKGIQLDKTTQMIGSYAPKAEEHSYTSTEEDAPSGLIARGTYAVENTITDDDKHIYMKWNWKLEIKKDWE